MATRREVLGMLSTVSVGAATGGSAFAYGTGTSNGMGPKKPTGHEIFRNIGVEPIINCVGTYTIIGGSLERPEVREAMNAAAHSFVQYDELAEGIGKRLAEITGAEWGMVSAGCAAAMKHATAACVTGGNPEKLIRIPDLTGFDKTEVIIPRHSRNAYDHAVRNIGIEVIEVDSAEEMKNAIGPKTAMIYMLAGRTGELGLKAVSQMAKPHKIPVLVDAAAEDLTIPNVHFRDGATMVCYSGGKALRGPQCAGLLLGPKDLLMAAWQASSPHHGAGRDNKVGREEMMGMLAAVESWVKLDHEGLWEKWLSYMEHIKNKVSKIDGIYTKIEEPDRLSNHTPGLEIAWDPDQFHMTGWDLAEEVGRTKPRIAVHARDEGHQPGTTAIFLAAWMMQEGDDKVVADRLYELLTKTRSPKPSMASPATDLSGRWKVNVEFFTSNSEHVFNIASQEGNWVKGTHKSDFSTQDISGTIAGNEVRLESSFYQPGDRIPYSFTGTLSGDKISGDVYLGEYLTAKFTAIRQEQSDKREPVKVPGGPVLAN